jgi:hypothetical protein
VSQTKLTPEQFDKLHALYLEHPEYFVVDILGAKPWEKQVEIIQSVFNYRLTSVKTCNAIGKSYIAARIVLTYLMLYKDSIVVTTAPTWRQVTDILWREIATAHKQAEMRGFKLSSSDITKTGLNLDTQWYAVGLSTARPENFFGYHADRILVVVDEAGGVDESIFDGVSAITTSMDSRILYIGNPTQSSGMFYDTFSKPELGANCISISAFDTPNFTQSGITTLEELLARFTPPEGVSPATWIKKVNNDIAAVTDPTYRQSLISPSVVFGRYHEYGTTHPRWQSLTMGEFPDQADQALIPADLIRAAMQMYDTNPLTGRPYRDELGWTIPDGKPIYGQDMARFGSDQNVNTPTRGGWVEQQIIWNRRENRPADKNVDDEGLPVNALEERKDNKLDLVQSAERILTIIDPLDYQVTVNIDDTGNGGGTTDALRQKSREEMASGRPAHQYRLNAYVFGSKEMMTDHDKQEFADITSKMYWNLRDWFYHKAIAMHFDQQLYDELASRQYGYTKDGKIKVESKEEYKKRTGGKSPDQSDSLALAFARKKPTEVYVPPSAGDDEDEEEESAAFRPHTAGLSGRF